MSISRRTLLLGAATAPVVSKSLAAGPQPITSESFALPAKKLFASMPYTYLDSGSTHPLSLGAKAALEDYLRSKTRDAAAPAIDMDAKQESVMRRFATLVGAHPEELCFVQSTTMGENLVIQALGLPARGGRIVTDALHFFGSFYTYGELGKAGMDVVTLRMTKEGAIDLNEMANAIDERTRLVAVSLVSTINGYEHDLKRVCEIAHARGAHVYADIVHAAGAIPVNLHESGVDFAACSSYKWLMGDFGLGFLYVRKDLQEKIRRPWWGYHQLASFATHVYPHDAPGSAVADYAASPDASGQFAMGTFSYAGVMLVDHSLGWLEKVGVPAIQAWRQPMIDRIQKELRARGYEPLTPLASKTPLVAFALADARDKLVDRLEKAGVRITTSKNRFRVSIAVFNDMNDVDRLLEALPRTPPTTAGS